ncbi:hypothetical protein DRO37_05630 [Candidatus Bathyarchaeota archaeon]|nr:MAG: hypothetical protein DRO37_05630 [Candidatus Bathyarchaeota archaeon]
MGLISLQRRLISLLAEELKEYIPQFEPYSADYQMVLYASKDLQEWMKHEWSLEGVSFYESLERLVCERSHEFRVFLKPWVSKWIEKWRERVKLMHTQPKLPENVQKKIMEAKKIYRRFEFGRELKALIIRKLIRHGEICMPSFIAENLIIEEIAKRMKNAKPSLSNIELDPLDIYSSLSERISRLPMEKGPLIYLRVKPRVF